MTIEPKLLSAPQLKRERELIEQYPIDRETWRVVPLLAHIVAQDQRIAEIEQAASARAADLDKARTMGTAETYIVTELWTHMSDEQRLALIERGCRWCGGLERRCCCQRDD